MNLREWLRKEISKLIKAMDAGEADHHGAFYYPTYQLEGFGPLSFDCIQNSATEMRVSIGVQTNKYGSDHYKVDPPPIVREALEAALKDLGYSPEPGWNYEGGFRFITNYRSLGKPWQSEYCTLHQHFVLIKDGKSHDGKKHVIR